jgi:hypothetical protein
VTPSLPNRSEPALLLLIKTGHLHLGWTWLIVLGTGTTMLLGYIFSLAKRRVVTDRRMRIQ